MSGDVYWLKDEHMLPRAIPQSRILRFGYESQWLGKDAIKQRLSLVADQLLRGLMESRKVQSIRLASPKNGAKCVSGMPIAANSLDRPLLWGNCNREGWSCISAATTLKGLTIRPRRLCQQSFMKRTIRLLLDQWQESFSWEHRIVDPVRNQRRR